MRYTSATYGRKVIIKKPEGYEMDGKLYDSLAAAVAAIGKPKRTKQPA